MNQRLPVPETTENNEVTVILRVEDVLPNPLQPRTLFLEDEIQELGESILVVGQKKPIVVRSIGNGKYQLVNGERRLRAHIYINKETIRAVVVELPDTDLLLESVAHNARSKNFTPRDTLCTIYNLTKEGKSIEVIAAAFSRKVVWVKTFLRLKRTLAPELQAILQHEGKEGELLIKDAVEIAKIPNHKHQIDRHLKTQDMSKSLRETLIKKAVEQTAKRKPRKPRSKTLREQGNGYKVKIEAFHLFLGTLSDIPADQVKLIFYALPSLDAERLEEIVDSSIARLKSLSSVLNKRNK